MSETQNVPAPAVGDPAAPTTPSKVAPLNLQAGINVTLLGRNIDALYSHNQDAQQNTHNTILIAPTDFSEPKTISFGEMIDQFKQSFGMGDTDVKQLENAVNSTAKQGSAFDINQLKISLNSAFLYLDHVKAPNAEKGQIEKCEYALSVFVDLSKFLPDLGFIKINSVFFNLWNLTPEQQQKVMHVADLETTRRQILGEPAPAALPAPEPSPAS